MMNKIFGLCVLFGFCLPAFGDQSDYTDVTDSISSIECQFYVPNLLYGSLKLEKNRSGDKIISFDCESIKYPSDRCFGEMSLQSIAFEPGSLQYFVSFGSPDSCHGVFSAYDYSGSKGNLSFYRGVYGEERCNQVYGVIDRCKIR